MRINNLSNWIPIHINLAYTLTLLSNEPITVVIGAISAIGLDNIRADEKTFPHQQEGLKNLDCSTLGSILTYRILVSTKKNCRNLY
jgi:hypothetical protein